MKFAIPILVCVAAGCSDAEPGRVTRRENPAEQDQETREAVRRWLKENTDSGKWEEVRWWTVFDVRKYEIAAAKKDVDLDPEKGVEPRAAAEWKRRAAKYLEDVKKRPPQFAIRVKYRTATPAGGKTLADKVFFLEGGRVAEHTDTGGYLLHWFPD